MSNEFETLKKEFEQAVRDLHIARQNFNNADAEYFDIANSELSIALARVGACRKKFSALE